MTRIVYNKLLQGWFVVRGPHQTPLNGRFGTKAEAQAYLDQRRAPRRLWVSQAPPRHLRGLDGNGLD